MSREQWWIMDEAGADACGAVFGGRYRIERSLKSGNGVDTLLARELETDTPVVLKSIDPSLVPAAARLRSSTRVSSCASCPGAVCPACSMPVSPTTTSTWSSPTSKA